MNESARPRIVVLDGFTLNPGDLTWEALEGLGELTVHERTPAADVLERSHGAAVLLTNKTVLGSEELDALPDCRYIGVLATGYNVVDIAAAADRGIVVTNVPSYGTTAVAQMTFAHILNLTQRIGMHAASVSEGDWSKSEDFCYWRVPLVELAGQTLGVVGLGRIGQAVAAIGRAFGMEVVGFDPVGGPVDGVTPVDLDALFSESDVVSLHCPLTAENAELVCAARLKLMKPTAFVVNTSRGGLVNEADLAAALNDGSIAGAGLDVLGVEPPDEGNPLLHARNCFVTPHIAWATSAARQRLLNTAVDNVRAFLAGSPKNRVTA